MGAQKRDSERPKDYGRKIFEIRRQERIDDVTSHLGIDADRVVFVEHHLAHLTAAYYTAPNVRPNQPVLGLTCDGSGDGIAGSVSIYEAMISNGLLRSTVTRLSARYIRV